MPSAGSSPKAQRERHHETPSTRTSENSHERAVVEEMLAIPIKQVVPTYNTNTADDPNGAGTSRGSTFTLDTSEALSLTTTTTSVTRNLLGQVVDVVDTTLRQTTTSTSTGTTTLTTRDGSITTDALQV